MSVIDYGDVLYLSASAHRLHLLDGEFHYRLLFSYSSLSIDALLSVHRRVFLYKAAAERRPVYCSSLFKLEIWTEQLCNLQTELKDHRTMF